MTAPDLEGLLGALASELPEDCIRTAAGDRWPYASDNSKREVLPDVVACPSGADEVRTLVELCRRFRVPITARGRGTATTGAAVPVEAGLVLSFERMDALVELEPGDRMAVVQPGLTNGALQEAAAAHGLFWPPDPTSAGYSSIGGNLACNAAGPRAVKYGTPRENTLGLQAVDGMGRVLRTGCYTTKGVVGYDLTRLLIGSEGTLGLITEAVLRLLPSQAETRTLRAVYAGMADAAEAVSRIMRQPVTPCALEFIDGAAIEMIRDHAEADLPRGAGAMLMIEVDGDPAWLDQAVEAVGNAARGAGLLALDRAATESERAELWAARKALSPALRNIAPGKINEDVAVPVSRMAELVAELAQIGERHAITIVNFGHAGNGNIHVNLLMDPEEDGAMDRAERCLAEVFRTVLRLRGTLSGEHGIGLIKREHVGLEIQPEVLEVMRGVKRVFDPDGILNPGKLFPDE